MAHPQETFSKTQFKPYSFWSRRRELVREKTLAYQLRVLKDTGRYDAFKLKWNPIYDENVTPHWPVAKHQFWDSDVAKWIEGACYFLTEGIEDGEVVHSAVNAEVVHSAVTELVEMIRKAQQPDGYINIHFTIVQPEKRFTNVTHLHELYNAGHLIEAALAHHHCYKNTLLLEPIIKYVDLIHKTFGPGPNQIHGYPGHPEIELALFRLYERTKYPAAYDLASYFITERGSPVSVSNQHFYDAEAEQRGEPLMMRPDSWPQKRSYWYGMAHKPLIEQETIEGHSVRAMYLLTAVADYVRTGDPIERSAYKSTLERLWNNMERKKMYMTGGIGAMPQWEGFGINYFLPQGTDEGGCYAETCASVGVMMLAERLLQLDLDGTYGDCMEKCLYNAVLPGMGSDGTSFTYTNQLASSESDPSKREEWFECACCPPNLARTIGILGGYLWTCGMMDRKAFVNVHLYACATTIFSTPAGDFQLSQNSNYPWEGEIDFKLDAPESLDLELRLRIPSWSKDFTLDPPLQEVQVSKGYVTLPPSYISSNPRFRLTLYNFEPHIISPNPLTGQNTLSVMRGPIVYCVEDVDNPWVKDHFRGTVMLIEETIFVENYCQDSTLDEVYVGITAEKAGYQLALEGGGTLRGDRFVEGEARDLVFIPYYFRANRAGKGQMRVGLMKC